MQGLITLDFGNTNPHAGFFKKNNDQWELLKVVPLAEIHLYLSQLGFTPNNSSIVLCEVKAREEEISQLQQMGFLVTRVKSYWRGNKFSGMPVNYAHTLGEDRLIEAFYCYKKEKIPTLIIDAGTFVTMDVVTDKGFLGGYIIPGAKAYFEAYEKGEQLKEISVNIQFDHELPRETTTAIRESYTAFAALAKSLIEKHQIKKVVITGSLISLWEGFFHNEKESLIVEGHPHLVHSALQYWMTTQIELL